MTTIQFIADKKTLENIAKSSDIAVPVWQFNDRILAMRFSKKSEAIAFAKQQPKYVWQIIVK
jgi:hypothetical protein